MYRDEEYWEDEPETMEDYYWEPCDYSLDPCPEEEEDEEEEE